MADEKKAQSLRRGLKIAVFYVVVFIATVITTSLIINRNVSNDVVEAAGLSTPVVYIRQGGYTINEMTAYHENNDAGYLRDSITPVSDSFQVTFYIKENLHDLGNIRYILKDSANEREIASGSQFTEESSAGGTRLITVQFSQMLTQDEEYCLTLELTDVEGEIYYYYTRLKYGPSYAASAKLDYVLGFMTATFSEESIQSLAEYMETDSNKNNNTSYTNINLYSSIEMLGWGDMDPVVMGDVVTKIKDINSDTASIELTYKIRSYESEEGSYKEFNVTEFYRVHWNSDVIYLMDFQRSLEEIVSASSFSMSDTMLRLGVLESDALHFMTFEYEVEVEDGDESKEDPVVMYYSAFTANGQLWCYNATDNLLTKLFTYDNEAVSGGQRQYDAKALRVDANGDVFFTVYGHFQEGGHLGDSGVIIYKYTQETNSVEELLFIPSDNSWEMIINDVSRLAYMNENYQTYLLLEDSIYLINHRYKEYQELYSGLTADSFSVSEDSKILILTDSDEEEEVTSLKIIYLETDEEKVVETPGKIISLLGFYNGDIVYGEVDQSRIYTDESGVPVMPMDRVCIMDTTLNVVKEYEKSGYYIMSLEPDDTSIKINLARENNGKYTVSETDYLLNNREQEEKSIYITQIYEDIYRYVLALELNAKYQAPIAQTARLLASGSETEMIIETDPDYEVFYLFARGGIYGQYTSIADAVSAGNSIYSGTVMDNRKNIYWQRSDRASTAYLGISSIEEGDDLKTIMQTLMEFEGIEGTVAYESNMNIPDLIRQNLNKEPVNLSGMELTDVLYMVHKGSPVIVKTKKGTYAVIVGYNEYNLSVADPITGTVMDWTTTTFTKEFKEAGAIYFTYR